MNILILQPLVNKTEEEVKELNEKLRIKALQLFSKEDESLIDNIQFNNLLNNGKYLDDDDSASCMDCLDFGERYLWGADKVIYYNDEQDWIMNLLKTWAGCHKLPIYYVNENELKDIKGAINKVENH